MEATLFSTYLDVRLFANGDRGVLIDQIEQLNHIRISHPNTAVTVRPANGFFMFCTMNVNEPIARVGVMFFHSIEPQNSRSNKIFRVWQWIIWAERNACFKNCSRCGLVTDLLRDPKLAQRGLEASGFRSETEPRTGNRVGTKLFPFTRQR